MVSDNLIIKLRKIGKIMYNQAIKPFTDSIK